MTEYKWKYFNGANFIFNGAWNDPQLEYKGKLINCNVIQDTLWERFRELEIEETEENFTTYCNEHQEEIEELFELTIEEIK